MKLSEFKHIYFLGIGGIGMSALARYFHRQGKRVGGYDKTASSLTRELEQDGIEISYIDRGEAIVDWVGDPTEVLVVYTPAVPLKHGEFTFFKTKGYHLKKRAEVLGMITRSHQALAVAGTHGKTTTSALLAHVLTSSSNGCNAFLGGISTNYGTNVLIDAESPWVVVEADEFDRSFHHLNPFASIVTSTDADHLDIYDSADQLVSAFQEYVLRIDKRGYLIVHHTVQLESNVKTISYGVETSEEVKADYIGKHLRVEDGFFCMDVDTPNGSWSAVLMGMPGIHNAENTLAVIALCEAIGMDELTIRNGLNSFTGVKRRFEYHIRNENRIFIDDYAHHPTAIRQLLASVRMLYPGKQILGVFQPHLFSRTRDFMQGFIDELSQLDELVLLPIYPAREEPIDGVTSDALLAKITAAKKYLLQPTDVAKHVLKSEATVVLTIGAGDIDRLVAPIKNILS